MADLRTDLTSLIGDKSAKLLAKALDINTAGDLLRHYPRRYAQRGELTSIAGVELGEHVTVMARVVSAQERRMRQRRGSILEVTITDGTRQLRLAFFAKTKYHERILQPGKTEIGRAHV